MVRVIVEEGAGKQRCRLGACEHPRITNTPGTPQEHQDHFVLACRRLSPGLFEHPTAATLLAHLLARIPPLCPSPYSLQRPH